MNTDAWRTAFDERHQFDVYPDHFMSGLRNEFCAGWHAALKSQTACQPKALTDRAKDALDSVIHFYSINGAEDVAEELGAILESAK
jgi:hypothetical protein